MTITFEYINAAVPPGAALEGGEGYENAANYACKVFLQHASADPVGFRKALDAYRENPYGRDMDNLLTEEERELIVKGEWGLTGFQWGWAVGTAAWLLEQPPVPNGALITIGVPE